MNNVTNNVQPTTLVAGIMASTSLDMARSLDWSLTEGIAPGPLHGVPLSLKESYEMQGHDVTLGIAKLSSVPCRETEALVRCLISAGAVPFCRTNLPQTMLSFGCSNPIYGVTSNPYDVTRFPS
jgi:Asp-tRNA(Asn)/Glu-tRNA(Gln) amidotransferase A subunit family amidase